ncbi:hypothetical protein C8J57DRAFT_1366360 [Mycena rebaudengoi]|nr:hypothetical protein C8J57DRAFT_1366360 [Mycena rebaudengoi]
MKPLLHHISAGFSRRSVRCSISARSCRNLRCTLINAHSPYLSISLIQVRNRVPGVAPGSASSPMASPAPPHTLPPTVLSPLSPASVFFLAHVCSPPHPAAATPLPPAPHSRSSRPRLSTAVLLCQSTSTAARSRRRSFEQWWKVRLHARGCAALLRARC